MTGTILFILTQLSIALFGLAFWFHPALRPLPRLARLSLCFMAGAVVLTVDATMLSLLGQSWGERTLPVPVIVLSIILIRRWRKYPDTPLLLDDSSIPRGTALAAGLVLLTGLAHLALASWLGTVASVDFALFWAAKASYFSSARGLSTFLLQWPYAIHMHQNYPPLFPMTLSWSTLLVQEEMFHSGLLTAPLWLLAAVPLIQALLRTRMRREHALIATTFWAVAMSASLAASYSAGNAEAPLIACFSVGLLAVLLEGDEPTRPLALVCAFIGLGGMLLTKVEGVPLSAMLLVGWVLANRHAGVPDLARRGMRLWLPAVAAASSWWLFQIAKGIALSDAARERGMDLHFDFIPQIGLEMLRRSDAGTFGLSWLLPLFFLLVRFRRTSHLLPAIIVVVGSFAFYFFYYLHPAGDPTELIGWTYRRVSQPALSALIVAAALVTFERRGAAFQAAPRQSPSEAS